MAIVLGRTARRAIGFALLGASIVASYAALHPRPAEMPVRPATAGEARVDAGTRFEYVARFPAGTPATVIEAWRQDVLARPLGPGCGAGRSCLQRLLRLSEIGPQRAEVVAFDLQYATPVVERAAIEARARAAAPDMVLVRERRPADP